MRLTGTETYREENLRVLEDKLIFCGIKLKNLIPMELPKKWIFLPDPVSDISGKDS